MAPAGTPTEIIDSIAKETFLAVRNPKVAERLNNNGVDPLGNSPEEFAAMIAADIAFWTEALKIVAAQAK
jgi:tripartite-type tricarboxylate transporter receptor subunit TctC